MTPKVGADHNSVPVSSLVSRTLPILAPLVGAVMGFVAGLVLAVLNYPQNQPGVSGAVFWTVSSGLSILILVFSPPSSQRFKPELAFAFVVGMLNYILLAFFIVGYPIGFGVATALLVSLLLYRQLFRPSAREFQGSGG